MSAVLDTHIVLWYLENSQELSSVARTAIEDAVRTTSDVHISAISLVETVYLVERRRLPLTALNVFLGCPHIVREERIHAFRFDKKQKDQSLAHEYPKRLRFAGGLPFQAKTRPPAFVGNWNYAKDFS
jgi:PIN domain nuclease of toxin-antitoxin system